MKKLVGVLILTVLLLIFVGGYATGTGEYEIIIDNEYNATLNVLDESRNIKKSISLGQLHFAHDQTAEGPVEALNASIAEKETQIEALIASSADKDEQIELLVTSAALKDAKIEILEKDITEKTDKIATLETDVSEKASKIESLKSDAAEKAANIEKLEADVEAKAGTIKTLEADAIEKTTRINTLEADIAKKTTEIETLEAEVTKKTTRIDNLEAEVTEKVTRIESLEADVADKADKITALVTEVTEKVKEIEKQKTDIASKDMEIDTLSASVTEKMTQIEALSNDVAYKAEQIDTLTSKNTSLAAQLLMFKQMIVDEGAETSSQKINSLLVIVPTKDFVIERLSTVSDIAKIDAVTVDNDPNGQLGKKGQYIEQIYFSSPLVNAAYADDFDLDVIGAGTVCGGSVEVYRTITDAEERNRYLAYYDGSDLSSGSHTVIGTIVIRTSSSLSLVDQKKLEEEIVAALISEK